jgi:DNA-binding response OmpR family regulator
MSTATHVLVVDDDATTRAVLGRALAHAGHQVTSASSGEQALALLDQAAFDVVLTDIWMHAVSGIEVLRAARQLPDPPEVILITANSTVESAVAALRAGACDYLTKPCQPDEIAAAVAGAVARRGEQRRRTASLQRIAAELAEVLSPSELARTADPRPPELRRTVGELTLDLHRYTATLAGQPIHITPIEFTLLACLAEAAGRAVTWVDIAAHTHQARLSASDAHELLRVHVRNLRRKIGPGYLVTVRGVGFMLVDPRVLAGTNQAGS